MECHWLHPSRVLRRPMTMRYPSRQIEGQECTYRSDAIWRYLDSRDPHTSGALSGGDHKNLNQLILFHSIGQALV